MHPADKAYRARRERRLIIAEVRSRSRQRDRKLVCAHRGAEVAGGGSSRAWLSEQRQNISSAIGHGNHKRRIHRAGGILNHTLHLGEGQAVDGGRRCGRGNGLRSATATREK